MVSWSKAGLVLLVLGIALRGCLSVSARKPVETTFESSTALVILKYSTDFRFVDQKPFETLSLLLEGKAQPFTKEIDLLFPEERGYLGFKPHPMIRKAIKTQETGYIQSFNTGEQQNEPVLFRKYKLIFTSPLKAGEQRNIKDLVIVFRNFGKFYPTKVNFHEDQKIRITTVHRPATLYVLAESEYQQHLGDRYLHKQLFHNYVSLPLLPQTDREIVILNKHFTQSKKSERMVEISHWGNIWEHQIFKLHNRAAEFDDEYSTNAFNPGNPHNGRQAFKDYNIHVPHGSFGLFFRDELGNISTAHPYHEKDDIRINLIPRTALLGNWNLTWDISLNTPADLSLFRAGQTNKYKLVLPVTPWIKDLPHDEYQLQVALPQGARIEDFKVQGYSPETKAVVEYTYSFLDLFGRRTIKFIFKDFLGDIHPNAKLTVNYTFDESSLWVKPFYLVVLLGLAFLIAIGLSRFDTSFGSNLHNERYLRWKKRQIQQYLDRKKQESLEAPAAAAPAVDSVSPPAPTETKEQIKVKKNK